MMLSSHSLYQYSATIVCNELIPKFGLKIAQLLPNCIKPVILEKMSKRGLLTNYSLDLFEELLTEYTDHLDLSAEAFSGDDYVEIIARKQLPRLYKLDFNALKGYFKNGLFLLIFYFSILGCRATLTDVGVNLLAASPNSKHLKVIYFRRCLNLTDCSISNLIESCYQNLRSFNLAGCLEITDITLDIIAKYCQCLEGIDISLTKVTSSGLIKLSLSPTKTFLREVKMSKCRYVDATGVRSILSNCSLRICCFDGCPMITSTEMSQLLEQYAEKRFDGNEGLKQVQWTIY